MYGLTGSTWPGSFICCSFIHYLFRKVFFNILIQKFQKLQSPDRVFSTVYVLVLEQLLELKILYFLVFVTCYKHPLSRSFPDCCIIL